MARDREVSSLQRNIASVIVKDGSTGVGSGGRAVRGKVLFAGLFEGIVAWVGAELYHDGRISELLWV